MSKKIRLFIIALSISCFSCNFVNVYAESSGVEVTETYTKVMDNGGMIKYQLKDDGTAEIIHYYVDGVRGVIPESIENRVVTSIGYTALGDSSLTSIEIPDSVRSIADNAFD